MRKQIIVQKTNVLFLALCGLFLMMGCGEEVIPTTTTTLQPTVSVAATSAITGTAVASSDTVDTGDTLTFAVNMNAAGFINTLWVNSTSYSRTDMGIADLSTSGTFSVDVATTTEGAYSLNFLLVDDVNQSSDTAVFTYVVQMPAPTSPALTENTVRMLGGFSNTTLGSFYDVVTDSVYLLTTAIDSSANIDLLFYYNDIAKNAIAALDNSETQATMNDQINATTSDDFVTKNETRFTKLTDVVYNDIVTEADLNTAIGDVSPADERLTDLAVNDIFAIQLATSRGSRKGIVEVQAISGTDGSDRQIELRVKIAPASTN